MGQHHTAATTRLAEIQSSPACVNSALFLHQNGILVTLFSPFILAVISVILTAIVRDVTLGRQTSKTSSTPSTGDTIPTQSEVPTVNDASTAPTPEEPPPYEPAIEPIQKPKVQSSSAFNFVLGTSLFIANVVVLVLCGLSVQALIHCSPLSPVSVFGRFIFWFLYSLVVLRASIGATCWAILFRNLWGPRVAKKWPIEESALIILVLALLISPFVMVGKVFILMIEACQRRFCGDVIEDEEEALELREETALGGDEEAEGSGSVDRREESVGLMSGVEK